MPRHLARCIMAVVFLAAGVSADPAHDSPGTDVYALVERSYRPHLDPDDPLAWPMKIERLATEPYVFWRGSKDYFYRWAQTHCRDWVTGSAAVVPGHGDLHLGNIGTYLAVRGEGHPVENDDAIGDQPPGTLAFGMVDFDESIDQPFELELLQGVITLRLAADAGGLDLSDDPFHAAARRLVDAYREAVASDKTAGELCRDIPMVRKLLDATLGTPINGMIERVVDEETGRFRPAVTTGRGRLREVLRPMEVLGVTKRDVAEALALAVENDEAFAALSRYRTAGEFEEAIVDVAHRLRLGSSGSQGLRKVFILLDSPLNDRDGPGMLYLKEQIPTAAERQGVVEPDGHPPGERSRDVVRTLTDPHPLVNAWCDLGTSSYLVTIREPWGDELSAGDVDTFDKVLESARVWGYVAGSAHRITGDREALLAALTDDFADDLIRRAEAFLAEFLPAFETFREDERVRERREEIRRLLEPWGGL